MWLLSWSQWYCLLALLTDIWAWNGLCYSLDWRRNIRLGSRTYFWGIIKVFFHVSTVLAFVFLNFKNNWNPQLRPLKNPYPWYLSPVCLLTCCLTCVSFAILKPVPKNSFVFLLFFFVWSYEDSVLGKCGVGPRLWHVWAEGQDVCWSSFCSSDIWEFNSQTQTDAGLNQMSSGLNEKSIFEHGCISKHLCFSIHP